MSAAIKRDAGLLRELGYRGRQVLVAVKQLLRVSTRADKTFFVERLDRALRSGRLGSNVAITARGKDDGGGSQAQAAMSAICMARAHGVPYVHRPFTKIEHAEFDMATWVRAWEEHFNLGAGETELGVDRKVVPIERIDRISRDERCVVTAEHYLHFCNADPDAWERVLPELRAKFWSNKTREPRAREVRIAVHMRRGDVSAGDKKVARNFTPNAIFVNTLTRLRALLDERGRAAKIELFSQGDAAMFADLVALGAELRLDVPALETHRALVEADVLVMSKGAFSYTAGVLCDGIVLYDPQKYRPLQGWIVRTPDGFFDETLLARRLDALLAAR